MNYTKRYAVGLMTILLAACGGGGGGKKNPNTGTPASTAQPPSATMSYLFFVGNITAVDPRSGAQTALSTGLTPDWAGALPTGTYDPTTRTMSDLHTRWVVYASGGQLWKVGADINATPQPQRLSSETEARTICENYGGPDLANDANARIVYALPGPDDNCQSAGDNVWRAVRIGMTAADAPISAKPVITSFSDPANGGLGGWLVREGNDLKVYDADFAQSGTLISAGRIEYLQGGTSDKLLIRAGDDLHVFDTATRTLSPRRHTLSNPVYSYTRDGSDVWVLDGDDFFRYSLNDSAQAVKVAEDAQDVRGSNIEIAGDRIVYILARPGATATQRTYVVKSLPKSGGAPMVLADNLSGIGGFAVAGSRVYFNALQGNTATAWSMLADGTLPAAIPNAAWTDSIADAEISPQRGRTVHTMLLTEGYTNADVQFGGGTLSSYDAATFTRVATLGQLPSDMELIRLGTGTGRYFLGVGYGDPQAATAPRNQDIFLIDTFTSGSLQRLTNTPLPESAVQ